MADYKKLYPTLFNKMTGILEEIKETQQMTEQEVISSPEMQVVSCKNLKKEEEKEKS